MSKSDKDLAAKIISITHTISFASPARRIHRPAQAIPRRGRAYKVSGAPFLLYLLGSNWNSLAAVRIFSWFLH